MPPRPGAPPGPTTPPVAARFITQLVVRDPDTDMPTELEIWQDPTSGALFGIDASFLDQVDDTIRSPYNPAVRVLLHADALAPAA